jgi:hypothetical protein
MGVREGRKKKRRKEIGKERKGNGKREDEDEGRRDNLRAVGSYFLEILLTLSCCLSVRPGVRTALLE